MTHAAAVAHTAYAESPLTMPCCGETLVGIVTRPAGNAPARTAVLIVVGGPQYRAGSHRQFTLLARALAAHGCASLRFDVRGMGDSSGDPRTFEQISDDVGAAIDSLGKEVPQAEGIVLWGLCDGASAALLYLRATRDRRVTGLCLVNPWVRSEQTLAQTYVAHYYGQRLRQAEFWKKVLRGGVGLGALRDWWQTRQLARSTQRDDRPTDYRHAMQQALAGFAGPVLLVLSGKDYTAQEFVAHAEQDPGWQKVLSRPQVKRLALPEADHTLSRVADERTLHAEMAGWLRSLGDTPR